ncbi:nitroreductase/quinone reductase family protein [Actinomadura hibisca]|uniref:nitroreductase/quinone reductase family protein n=1 Tax=Actinomadura hibisca TaxID=68565 RepID=UPI00082BC0FD|nr:nitroreductase/quinone reductase family protein [Actinomadura hibisca]
MSQPFTNEQIIAEFRANAGRVGGFFAGATLLLLTTTGARSGRRRTTPVMCTPDGDRLLVFASNGGAPTNPAWYHNLLAEPQVTVEIGEDGEVARFEATAVPLRGDERDEVYRRQSELVPAFAEYQRGTDRVIPVVALYRDAHAQAGAAGEFLVKVHEQLRRDLAALRETAVHQSGRPSPDLVEQLRARCRTVCGALTEHHGKEDSVFPRLQEHAPELAPALDRLRREHVVVARRKQELLDLVESQETADDPARFAAELDRLIGELEDHFDYEEKHLVAALDDMLG